MFRYGIAARLSGIGVPLLPMRGGHISLFLLWVQALLSLLERRQIGCYRLPSEYMSGLQSGDLAQLNHDLSSCASLIEQLQQAVTRAGVRFSVHLPIGLGPAADDRRTAAQWRAAVAGNARLLEILGGHGVIVSHLGSRGDAAALLRAAAQIEQLAWPARQWLAIEPDERSVDLSQLLALHDRCGVAVIFDSLHHQINNPERISTEAALRGSFGTWPLGMRPKIHLSSQRTEAHAWNDAGQQRVIAPQAGQHADFLNPFEAADLLAIAAGIRPFDAMIEAKAGELALLRLREDLRRYRPEVADLEERRIHA
jgi:UV DNA damage endonuclease